MVEGAFVVVCCTNIYSGLIDGSIRGLGMFTGRGRGSGFMIHVICTGWVWGSLKDLNESGQNSGSDLEMRVTKAIRPSLQALQTLADACPNSAYAI